tara:strand:- start:402 stop:707 length:306 start_codon:yes stop_codon:yes gene_type:complete
MVELDVELLAKQYEEAHEAEAAAKRMKANIKKKLGQIMDLENTDDVSTCDWKILRQEEGGGKRLLSKAELQEKLGTKWISENSKDGKPVIKFYIRKKKLGE